MSFGGGGNQEVMSEINITPLCDIFVVLLIILMMTASEITAKGPAVDLPEMGHEVKNDAQVAVTLRSDKSLWVDNTRVERLEDLPGVLREALANPRLQNKHVIFCGEKGLLMREVVGVMMKCHEAGSDQVSIKTTVKQE